MTWRSTLLFQWQLQLLGGQMKSAELQIRADNAFCRGVHMPCEWAELSLLPSQAAGSCRFTTIAAHQAAKDATQKARNKLGETCTSVDCECPFIFYSLLLHVVVCCVTTLVVIRSANIVVWRYMGIDGSEGTMTANSMLIFEWGIKFISGLPVSTRQYIRARDVFDVGISMPLGLATVPQPEVLGDDAVWRLREELGLEDNVQVECRHAL